VATIEINVFPTACACGGGNGVRHDRGCDYPEAVAGAYPELWRVKRPAVTTPRVRRLDDLLEEANRRAMLDWVREGRPL
jgi:hypothetical protein